MKLVERTFAEADRRALLDGGLHPLLARLYASRRIRSVQELDYGPARLLAPTTCPPSTAKWSARASNM